MEFNEFVDKVALFEGYSPQPYVCPAGKLTIGFGKVIKPSEEYLYKLYKREDFYRLLESDLTKLYKYIDSFFDKQSPYKGNINVLYAITDFAYNIGTKNLLSHKTALGSYFAKICSKYASSDDLYQFSLVLLRYCHVGKKPLKGLQRRRLFDFRLITHDY